MTAQKIIDLREQSAERKKEAARTAAVLFRLNNTEPFTAEYDALLGELFAGGLGAGCFIAPPLYMNLAANLHIGSSVSINPYFRCMSEGNVYIEDGAQIAMNVSVVTNNHDFYDRALLTVQDVRIGRGAWIGTGAIILPGVTVGENAVVGAGSVVTHDVAPATVVAGNPARVIRRLDAERFGRGAEQQEKQEESA